MTTIRRRLLDSLLPGVVLGLAIGGASVYWIAKAGLMRQLDSALAARATALASYAAYDMGRLEFEFDQWHEEPMTDGAFEFRTPGGGVLRRSAGLTGASLPMREVEFGQMEFGDITLPGDVRARAVWMVFEPRGSDKDDAEDDDDDDDVRQSATAEQDHHGALLLTAAIDRAPLDRALNTLLIVLVGVGGLLAFTIGSVVIVGVRRGLAPLDRLSRQLAQVGDSPSASAAKSFKDADAPDELAPVYRELNSMLVRVERTLERERSFADAAAHELRTPLAELRTTAEVAIRWPEPERAAAALREVMAIGGEMERLVESLLLISRANAHAMDATVADVPLEALVQRCLERARETVQSKRLRVSMALPAHAALSAPPAALEIIVRNLINNAVQYTPAGGSIKISAVRHGDGPLSLIVENGPVDLLEKDLPHLFQPFWRSDAARGDREHVGLGLTVVQRIAATSGLAVAAKLEGDRLRFRIWAAAASDAP